MGMTLFGDASEIQNTSMRRSAVELRVSITCVLGCELTFRPFSHPAKLYGIHAFIALLACIAEF